MNNVNCKKNRFWAALSASVVYVALTSTHAVAQADNESNDFRLEEVIVTAQKRAESTQDIPVAVTAFQQSDLAAFGVGSFDQLTKVSPAFAYKASSSKTFSSLYMRGVGTHTLGVGVEPSVSVVIDGIPVVQSAQALSNLNDVERIEVLRGPQGTLFGKNASAGVVSIITQGPTDTFEGFVEQTVTTDDELYTKAAVSGPINDDIAYRLSGYYRDFDGTAKDLVKGTKYNADQAWGLRGKLRWGVNEDLQLNFLLAYSKAESEGIAGTLREFGGPAAQLPIIYPGITPSRENTVRRTDAGQIPMATDDEDFRASMTLNYAIGDFTLTSLTSYDDWKNFDSLDSDFTDFNLAGRFGVPPPPGGLFQTEINKVEQIVEEIRLASPTSDKFEYMFGLFYENAEFSRTFQRLRVGTSVWDATLETDSVGLFGNFKWGLGESTFLNGGLRYNKQYYDVVYTNRAATAALPAGAVLLGDTTDDAVQGKVSLQHYLNDDLMLFVSYARGHKGLGYNITSAINQNQISHPAAAEKSDSYELGMKAEFLDGRLQLNATAFHALYSDFQAQTQVADITTGLNQLTLANVGELETQGLELESALLIANNFRLNLNLAYTDAVIKEFPNADCYTLQTAAQGCIAGKQNLSGKSASNSPDWKANISGFYTLQLGRLEGFANFAYSWQDEDNNDLLGNPSTVQGSYGTLNLSTGVEADHYKITLFVNNVFDKAYAAGLTDTGALFGFHITTQFVARWERYAGLTASFNF